jgi:hypothetical protein
MSNSDWVSLSDAEKGQLVSMWIVAADKGGRLPDEPAMIRKMCLLDGTPDINKFKRLGFIDAKRMPRRRQPDAPETEAETEAEEETDLKPLIECFDLIWSKYPNKQGKKTAEGHYNSTVKSEEDYKDICTALSNYISYIENPNTFQGYKHGATWFNNWKDWITFVPPPEKSQPVKKSEDFKKIEAIMGVNHVATGNNQNQSSETILTPQVRPQQRRLANDHGAMD